MQMDTGDVKTMEELEKIYKSGMIYEIKSWRDGKILYSADADSLKDCVEMAVKSRADLSSADLRTADLSSANLSSANLSSANLSYANLSSANLSSANLRYANLRYANLRYANLRSADLSSADLISANLSSANLSSANLRYADLISADLSSADLISANLSSANLSYADLRTANLSSANLRYAYLSYADLRSANLSDTRKDFLAVLLPLKNEVAEFYKHLLDGRIDGSTYEGECACLKGTFANIKKCNYNTLNPDDKSSSEILFLAIKEGDTPETNQVSAIVKEWTLEFMKEHALIVPIKKVVWE